MKKTTFLASLVCWRACWPCLTEVSRWSPSTHCQVLFYYGAFKTHMGQHRDNSDINFIKETIMGESCKWEGHPFDGGENSQLVGSNVLVLNMGNKPMNLIFKYPRKGKITDQKKSYITSPRHQFACSNFTVSVLDPIDDINSSVEILIW